MAEDQDSHGKVTNLSVLELSDVVRNQCWRPKVTQIKETTDDVRIGVL